MCGGSGGSGKGGGQSVPLTKEQAYRQFDAARLRHGELINANAPEAQIKAALAEKKRLRTIYQGMS